jgi:hypothetical protein
MNPDELAHLLTSMDAAHTLARAVSDPELQAAKGWNLTRWRCDDAGEAVRFVHHNAQGNPDTAVLCVDGAKASEWVYATAVRLAACPTRLVVLKN